MTRKTKIRFAVASIFPVLVLVALCHRHEPTVLGITMTHVENDRPGTVWFHITNHSDATLLFALHAEPGEEPPLRTGVRRAAARAATTEGFRVPTTAQWRLVVEYYEAEPRSFRVRKQLELGEYACDHHWDRLGRWLCTRGLVRTTYGPEMLGDQPVSAGNKESMAFR